MTRPSTIEATAAKMQPDAPPRATVHQLLKEHDTLSNVAAILGVSESALFRYVEKEDIKKKHCWVDERSN